MAYIGPIILMVGPCLLVACAIVAYILRPRSRRYY